MQGNARTQQGMSLIEIMIALTIGVLLLFGLSQIYLSSKVSYNLQNGMSHVQENARIGLQYLENNVRMAGYMGCGSDVDFALHPRFPPSFLNHLAACTMAGANCANPLLQPDLDPATATGAANFPLRFQRPIEAFHYTGTIPGASVVTPAIDNTATDWTPRLPAGLVGRVVAGSDVLVLRVISQESTPVIGPFDASTGAFTVSDPTFVTADGIYALTSCYGDSKPRADVFRATSGGTTVVAGPKENPLYPMNDSSSTWLGLNAIGFGTTGPTLNAEVHQARYIAIYVGHDTDGTPSLNITQLTNAGADTPFLDNVESFQVLLGVDSNGDGSVDGYITADNVVATGVVDPDAVDASWRKVLSVRIALLMRSPDQALERTGTTDTSYRVFAVGSQLMTRPADGRVRSVYDSTIALRNRLLN